MNAVETISCFSKAKYGHASQIKNNKRMKYFPQGIKESGVKKVTLNYHSKNITGLRPNQIGKEYMSYTGFPCNILIYNSVVGRKAIHPTQKPVPLLEYLIKTYTNEGEIVLDNCMGSGSTGIACINTNRKFIGIELDENYYKIAKNRIKQHYYEVNKLDNG